MAGEQFSLCWDNFHKNMSTGMHALLESEDLVDVTLACEGKYLKAHKMVLSVCSPYFRELFQMNPCKHPIVFMKDVSYTAMNDLLTFMYQGEVQVNQEQLTTFIKTAEALQIKGLTSDGNNDTTEIPDDNTDEVVTKASAIASSHENDVIKPVQRPRKIASHQPIKRQRISSPERERPLPVTEKSETPAMNQTTEQMIQFKMEPYEGDQSDQGQMESYEENPDDTFGDDGADETQMDDTDYSMLKGEEPQAGTSGDGMGESQDSKIDVANIMNHVPQKQYVTGDGVSKLRRRRCVVCWKRKIRKDTSYYCPICPRQPALCIPCFTIYHHVLATKNDKFKKREPENSPTKLRKFRRIVHNGFFYNVSTTRRCDRRYYRCANKKNSGCLATAVVAKNATLETLTILRPHNHPPDRTKEMKYNFELELTKAVKNSYGTIKSVYDALEEIHPDAAKLVPFDQNLCNRLKRRRASPHIHFAYDSE